MLQSNQPTPRSAPQRLAWLRPLASLRLTVLLLALAAILIFAGTSAQMYMSVWEAQHRYFHSWFTIIDWRLFVPLWEWGRNHLPGVLPFPGGYTLIVLLLANLLSAHLLRFKINRKRIGILCIHAGLILLLLGECATSVMQTERQMILHEGATTNWVFDPRNVELAIIDRSPTDHDRIVAIPAAQLIVGRPIDVPELPFTIQTDAFYRNSTVLGPMDPDASRARHATAGLGTQLGLLPAPLVKGTDQQMVDAPSALVSLVGRDGNVLGSYLVSTLTLMAQFPQIDQPQAVRIGGRELWISLRFVRDYRPYSVHLAKFSNDVYTGTDVARNFSSDVRLVDATRNVDRDVRIWMNHPLRYAGETFYQSSFKPGEQTSILQVVRNPGWLVPYISCSLVGLGLIVHFGMHLRTYLSRQLQSTREESTRAANSAPSFWQTWGAALGATAVAAIYLLSSVAPADAPAGVELDRLAHVPVSFDGRTMPLDSLARNVLRILSGRSELKTDAGTISAIEWLSIVQTDPQRAMDLRVFRIDLPELLSLLGLDEAQKFYSAKQIEDKLDKLNEQYVLAMNVAAPAQDLFQRKVLELAEHLKLFGRIASVESLYLSPPLVSDQWRTYADAKGAAAHGQPSDPGAESYDTMLRAIRQGDAASFNAVAQAYLELVGTRLPGVAHRVDVEVLFNRIDPFIKCMAFYVAAFVLAAVSWLKWGASLRRAAFSVLVLALIVHTLGLVTRIYLQGRPPVTNLYSSAIFIAWGAVLFCVFLELLYRNGVAVAAACALAFPSLLIAHYLAGSGDTMKMLQAVLDTNIWLATHVVVITLGYTATFLAGFLAIGFILWSLATKEDSRETGKTLARMVYGTVCFAMLFSFVGTILGGIWADQSWGRFWGWDPKENGAVLIVIWNAIILHARWGGLVRERGMMNLAVLGNIVTAWSWFGTNMLGVGLHSYGFMEHATVCLASFVALQLVVIGLSFVPGMLPSARSIPQRRPNPG